MEHLAKDLSVALEESESCGSINAGKWNFRRRTRSTGNLHLYVNKSGDNHSDASSSSNSEIRTDKHRNNKIVSFHQSDSDDTAFNISVNKAIHQRTSLRMKNPMYSFLKGNILESDSVNENSPVRPYFRRKRKFKRMSIDEATPLNTCGKRKRSQRLEPVENRMSHRQKGRIKPLHQSLIDKIERIYPAHDGNQMEIQTCDENCEVGSESSISWSGGEGHEGDDELTDWAPSMENSSNIEQPFNDSDPREIRAGCRRLGEERPGFSISTSANERVAKFLQDATKSELRLYGAERDKLGQLATLYSLDLRIENATSSLLRKTTRTPFMQPQQRHHSGFGAVHKKIRTQNNYKIS